MEKVEGKYMRSEREREKEKNAQANNTNFHLEDSVTVASYYCAHQMQMHEPTECDIKVLKIKGSTKICDMLDSVCSPDRQIYNLQPHSKPNKSLQSTLFTGNEMANDTSHLFHIY